MRSIARAALRTAHVLASITAAFSSQPERLPRDCALPGRVQRVVEEAARAQREVLVLRDLEGVTAHADGFAATSPLMRSLFGGFREGGLSGSIQPVERLLLCVQANVRIVLKHPPREVAGDRLDNVIGLAGLEQPRHNCVPQVVEP
jgi:hypothetical protein